MIKFVCISPLASFCTILLTLQFQIPFVLTQDPRYSRLTYCRLDCGSSIHTLCQSDYPCHNICRHGYSFKFLTDSQRESMLNAHNDLRNWIASGNENSANKQFADTKAANMSILSWSREAEYIASCMARRCDPGRDSCRSLADGTNCGQNFYVQGQSKVNRDLKKLFKGETVLNEIVEKWYTDLANYKRRYKDEYDDWEKNKSAFGPSTYTENVISFSQIVWAKTKFVGCSYNIYRHKNADRALVYCNYCPIGNVFGEPIFEIGKEKADCSSDKRYPKLCGKQRPLSEDTFRLDGGSVLSCKNSWIVMILQINVLLFG